MVHLFNMKDVSVFLFPLAETLSLDCNSTVMVQEVAGGEDRVPRLPLLAVLILLLLGLVVAVGVDWLSPATALHETPHASAGPLHQLGP